MKNYIRKNKQEIKGNKRAKEQSVKSWHTSEEFEVCVITCRILPRLTCNVYLKVSRILKVNLNEKNKKDMHLLFGNDIFLENIRK